MLKDTTKYAKKYRLIYQVHEEFLDSPESQVHPPGVEKTHGPVLLLVLKVVLVVLDPLLDKIVRRRRHRLRYQLDAKLVHSVELHEKSAKCFK